MPSKWDEGSIVVFLNVYRNYPCLWNPYDKDYYDCSAKNEALRNIIDDLSIPGFTVTDYLHQIKMIREKYKKEQMQVIKRLQTHKQHSSLLPWYDTMSDMLAKVITDEEAATPKVTSHIETACKKHMVKSLTNESTKKAKRKGKSLLEAKLKIIPCSDANYYSARKITSIEKIVPTLVRNNINVAHNESEDVGECKKLVNADRGSKEIKSNFNYPPNTSIGKGKENYEPLQCPSCGWEDLKHKRREVNAERPFQDEWEALHTDGIHYSKGKDSINEKFVICRGLNKEMCSDKNAGDSKDRDVTQKEYSLNSMKCRGKPNAKLYCQSHYRCTDLNIGLNEEKGIDEQVQCNNGSVNGTQFQDHSTKICTEVRFVLPDSDRKFQTTILKCDRDSHNGQIEEQSFAKLKINASTKGIQHCPEHLTKGTSIDTNNSIEQAIQTTQHRTNRTTSTVNLKHCSLLQGMSCSKDVKETSDDKTQTKSCMIDLTPVIQSKQVGINTVEQVHTGTQNTLCMSNTNVIQCSIMRNFIDVGTSTTPLSCQAQTTISTDLALQKDERTNNFVLLTPEGNYIYLTQVKLQEFIKTPIEEDFRLSKEQHKKHTCEGSCKIDAMEVINTLKECVVEALKLSHAECKNQGTKTFESDLKYTDSHIESSFIELQSNLNGDTFKPEKNASNLTLNNMLPLSNGKIPVTEKEVFVQSTNHDIGTSNISLHEIGIQSSPLNNNSPSPTRDRRNTGTQKRDPILVCLVKCNQEIVKSDKSTFISESDRTLEKNDKHLGTCNQSICMPHKAYLLSADKSRKLNSIHRTACRRGEDSYKILPCVNFQCDKDCKERYFVNSRTTEGVKTCLS